MKYRTKPFEIEAVQFTGDNWTEVSDFAGLQDPDAKYPQANFAILSEPNGDIIAEIYDYLHETWVGVKASNYIVKGMKNEFYPCDAEVFESKYEPVFAEGGRVENNILYDLRHHVDNAQVIPKRKLTDDNEE